MSTYTNDLERRVFLTSAKQLIAAPSNLSVVTGCSLGKTFGAKHDPVVAIALCNDNELRMVTADLVVQDDEDCLGICFQGRLSKPYMFSDVPCPACKILDFLAENNELISEHNKIRVKLSGEKA